MDTIATPGIGHNNPPPPATLEELSLALTLGNTDLAKRTDDIVAAKERVPEAVADEEAAGRLTEFVRQCQAAIRTAKDRHGEAKRPYLDLGRAVDNFFRLFIERIEDVKAVAEKRLAEFARRKREAQEARDRERQNAYEIAGIEPPPSAAGAPVRVRSEYGGVATQTERWTFEIENIKTVPLATLRPFIARDAIEKAIRAYIRHHHKLTPDQIPPLKGVRIFQQEKVTVR